MTDVCRPRRFPPLCGIAALWGSWMLIGVGGAVSVWAGLGFNQNVSMLWLISCFASFLFSCLLLEPLKVRLHQTLEALWVSPSWPGGGADQHRTKERLWLIIQLRTNSSTPVKFEVSFLAEKTRLKPGLCVNGLNTIQTQCSHSKGGHSSALLLFHCVVQ